MPGEPATLAICCRAARPPKPGLLFEFFRPGDLSHPLHPLVAGTFPERPRWVYERCVTHSPADKPFRISRYTDSHHRGGNTSGTSGGTSGTSTSGATTGGTVGGSTTRGSTSGSTVSVTIGGSTTSGDTSAGTAGGGTTTGVRR